MPTTPIMKENDRVFSSILRLNSSLLGLSLGTVFGLIVFVATNWLVIKGGHTGPSGQYVVGPHLQLLSQFFVGYRVSFLGSVIGFFYGFAIGTLAGATIGYIYNKIVEIRN